MVTSVLAKDLQRLFVTVGLVAVILVAGFAANYFATYASETFGAKTIAHLRTAVTERLLGRPVSDIERESFGDLVSRLTTDLDAVATFANDRFSSLVYIPILSFSSVVFLIALNWKLGLATFVATPAMMLVANWISKPLGAMSTNYYRSIAEANTVVQEVTSGFPVAKAYVLQGMMFSKAKDAYTRAMKTGLRVSKQEALLRPSVVLMYELPFVVCVFFGGLMAVRGALSVATLVAFLQLLRILVGPTVAVPGLIGDARSVSAALERIIDLFDAPSERSDGYSHFSPYVGASGGTLLVADRVSFGFTEGREVVSDVDFSVEVGKTIAFVGPSGSGKTTVLNLILGFYEPTRGSVRLLGHDVRQWDPRVWRTQFSVVSQDTILFPGTIEENIRYGDMNASYDEVFHAAQLAGAESFIRELPEGFNTQVGERGLNLSGGQRQRISIARAILKDAPILLLDEPTSALDSEHESHVQGGIRTLLQKRAVVIVAHRLSTIKSADEILVLDRGVVVERGTHNGLMRARGMYHRLYVKEGTSQNG